jgi:uncharacterized protein (DUF2252 family)
VAGATARYRTAMQEFAGCPNLTVWYASISADEILEALRGELDNKRTKLLEKSIAKTRTRDSMHAFTRLTESVDGTPRIISAPPLIQPVRDLLPGEPGDELVAAFNDLILQYQASLQTDRRLLLEQFEFVDMALKVVGVGSVGTRAWIILMMGKDGEDPLLLQFKEAQASVLEEFLAPSVYPTHGERVVAGQHLMQTSSDIFLGHLHGTGALDGKPRDFYGRQLKDWKGSIDAEALLPYGMMLYGQACAWTLARAHARSGDRIAIAAYLGNTTTFDEAITAFAAAYADQNQRDYEALEAAVGSGRITAVTGM